MIVSAVLIDAWVTGQTRPRKQPETHGPCECAGLEQNLAGVDLPACETEKSEVTGRDLVLLTISPIFFDFRVSYPNVNVKRGG